MFEDKNFVESQATAKSAKIMYLENLYAYSILTSGVYNINAKATLIL